MNDAEYNQHRREEFNRTQDGLAQRYYEEVLLPVRYPDGYTSDERKAVQRMTKWTPAARRLPKEETPVLLMRNGKVAIGERRWEQPTWEESFSPFWFWACAEDHWHDDPDEATVTHWMPLPQPPETKA